MNVGILNHISVGDADNEVSWGPGLRWGVMEPNLLFHLGGGQGGIEHFLAHLSGSVSRWWYDLGHPVLIPELIDRSIQDVRAEAASRTVAELEKQRDDLLIRLLALRAPPDSSPIHNTVALGLPTS